MFSVELISIKHIFLPIKSLIDQFIVLQINSITFPSFFFVLFTHSFSQTIKESGIEKYLSPLQPSTELANIVKDLKGKIAVLEDETKSMIAFAHFDIAERKLPIFASLCNILSCVDEVDVHTKYNALHSFLRDGTLFLLPTQPIYFIEQ